MKVLIFYWEKWGPYAKEYKGSEGLNKNINLLSRFKGLCE